MRLRPMFTNEMQNSPESSRERTGFWHRMESSVSEAPVFVLLLAGFVLLTLLLSFSIREAWGWIQQTFL